MHLSPLLPTLAAALVLATGTAGAALCDDFYARLPNVSRALCESAQLQASAARSVKGRIIYTRDLGPVAAPLRVLVVGAMHGDELSSASLALHWLRLAQLEAAPVHWRFIPALNPDGLFGRPARRMNANGVDLNRNFPTPNWARESVVYWEKKVRKDPRRWPGKRALSEPESRFLFDQMQSFRPDVVVSIHAPYGVLDFDGPVPAPTRLGRLHLEQLGVFPGSLGNYGGLQQGVPVVTVELANAQRTPTTAEMHQMWQDLHQWIGQTITPVLARPAVR